MKMENDNVDLAKKLLYCCISIMPLIIDRVLFLAHGDALVMDLLNFVIKSFQVWMHTDYQQIMQYFSYHMVLGARGHPSIFFSLYVEVEA
jgi:hypothetical protein